MVSLYTDVVSLKDLICLLRNGERLEKPSLMPSSIDLIMGNCWQVDPKARPTFSHLVREFGNMLGPDVQSHYLKMNEPYMQMNSSAYSNI